jgi:hypothetical protein
MSRVYGDMSHRARTRHGGMNVDENLGAPATTPERPPKAPFAARGLGGLEGAERGSEVGLQQRCHCFEDLT